ncbi:MAG: hypothetical protein PHR06_14445, partial [Candidatus Cloacimonetes bacterium]|nr:hypothetical protein [Candidatus Cloacimonadota bacterium]
PLGFDDLFDVDYVDETIDWIFDEDIVSYAIDTREEEPLGFDDLFDVDYVDETIDWIFDEDIVDYAIATYDEEKEREFRELQELQMQLLTELHEKSKRVYNLIRVVEEGTDDSFALEPVRFDSNFVSNFNIAIEKGLEPDLRGFEEIQEKKIKQDGKFYDELTEDQQQMYLANGGDQYFRGLLYPTGETIEDVEIYAMPRAVRRYNTFDIDVARLVDQDETPTIKSERRNIIGYVTNDQESIMKLLIERNYISNVIELGGMKFFTPLVPGRFILEPAELMTPEAFSQIIDGFNEFSFSNLVLRSTPTNCFNEILINYGLTPFPESPSMLEIMARGNYPFHIIGPNMNVILQGNHLAKNNRVMIFAGHAYIVIKEKKLEKQIVKEIPEIAISSNDIPVNIQVCDTLGCKYVSGVIMNRIQYKLELPVYKYKVGSKVVKRTEYVFVEDPIETPVETIEEVINENIDESTFINEDLNCWGDDTEEIINENIDESTFINEDLNCWGDDTEEIINENIDESTFINEDLNCWGDDTEEIIEEIKPKQGKIVEQIIEEIVEETEEYTTMFPVDAALHYLKRFSSPFRPKDYNDYAIRVQLKGCQSDVDYFNVDMIQSYKTSLLSLKWIPVNVRGYPDNSCTKNTIIFKTLLPSKDNILPPGYYTIDAIDYFDKEFCQFFSGESQSFDDAKDVLEKLITDFEIPFEKSRYMQYSNKTISAKAQWRILIGKLTMSLSTKKTIVDTDHLIKYGEFVMSGYETKTTDCYYQFIDGLHSLHIAVMTKQKIEMYKMIQRCVGLKFVYIDGIYCEKIRGAIDTTKWHVKEKQKINEHHTINTDYDRFPTNDSLKSLTPLIKLLYSRAGYGKSYLIRQHLKDGSHVVVPTNKLAKAWRRELGMRTSIRVYTAAYYFDTHVKLNKPTMIVCDECFSTPVKYLSSLYTIGDIYNIPTFFVGDFDQMLPVGCLESNVTISICNADVFTLPHNWRNNLCYEKFLGGIITQEEVDFFLKKILLKYSELEDVEQEDIFSYRVADQDRFNKMYVKKGGKKYRVMKATHPNKKIFNKEVYDVEWVEDYVDTDKDKKILDKLSKPGNVSSLYASQGGTFPNLKVVCSAKYLKDFCTNARLFYTTISRLTNESFTEEDKRFLLEHGYWITKTDRKTSLLQYNKCIPEFKKWLISNPKFVKGRPYGMYLKKYKTITEQRNVRGLESLFTERYYNEDSLQITIPVELLGECNRNMNKYVHTFERVVERIAVCEVEFGK